MSGLGPILRLMTSRTFLVTGASTGIGRSCVAQLVRGGASVWATVRGDADAEALRRDHGAAVTVLHLDVTDDAAVAEAGQRVAAAGALHGLVNNAGVAVPGPLEYLPIDRFRHQIEVNLTGQLAVTQAMLPALRGARESGEPARIVMVGSIGGRIAGPMVGAYHASKFALAGLSDSLRAELTPSGIPVVLVEPGTISTPIWSRGLATGDEILAQLPPEGARRYRSQISMIRAVGARAEERGLAPERVAEVVVTALTAPRPRPRYLVGRDARLGSIVARLPYRLQYRFTAAKR